MPRSLKEPELRKIVDMDFQVKLHNRCCFLSFKNDEDAEKAIKLLNQREVDGSKLRARLTTSEKTPGYYHIRKDFF